MNLILYGNKTTWDQTLYVTIHQGRNDIQVSKLQNEGKRDTSPLVLNRAFSRRVRTVSFTGALDGSEQFLFVHTDRH